ncbi:MAG: hypothetical protein LBG69_05255 [Zoogloeaceae bacterium]|jgi:hypothetical protein|nr:hypothetical protein [Zoogloeaceae bacterium]
MRAGNFLFFLLAALPNPARSAPSDLPPAALSAEPSRGAASMEIARDPFEVSARLRESKVTVGRSGQREGTVLSKHLRLKAVVRGPGGAIAKIESGVTGKETFIVQDGDELELDGVRYIVKVEADGLTLSGAGAPQYKMLIR